MRFIKGQWAVIFALAATTALTIVLTACEEDVADITVPQVNYLDQTFALLVCDGNGPNGGQWGHDGAPKLTLDWYGNGSGANRVPVNYVYNVYPILDGAVTENTATERGDNQVWDPVPWTTITTTPVYGGGSGITQVKVKTVFTYVNPPRIWFLFQWVDPSHTIRGDTTGNNHVGAGTLHYYWHKEPDNGDGSGWLNARRFDSRQDWLALVFSTWFIWNTEDKGQPREKDNEPNHHLPDLNGYNWECVETVPGFQANGLDVLVKGSGDEVYSTPPVSTQDMNSPYYWLYYEGPYCDLWFFSASLTNYTAAGSWAVEPASMVDGYIGTSPNGLHRPLGDKSLDDVEWSIPVDADIAPGYAPNGLEIGTPQYRAPSDPNYNPPGATYMWSSSATATSFNNPPVEWGTAGGLVISGYLHRPSLGGAADISGKCTWWDPSEKFYFPWDGPGDNTKTDPDERFPDRVKNLEKKEWAYTLEMEREIGVLSKNKPTEDALLGIFKSHPDQ